jgi:hypothetical protein
MAEQTGPQPSYRLRTCSSCSAPIFFALSPAGKKLPVDAQPVFDGGYVISEHRADVPQLVRVQDAAAPATLRFKSHYRTCPNAAQHSRNRSRRQRGVT